MKKVFLNSFVKIIFATGLNWKYTQQYCYINMFNSSVGCSMGSLNLYFFQVTLQTRQSKTSKRKTISELLADVQRSLESFHTKFPLTGIGLLLVQGHSYRTDTFWPRRKKITWSKDLQDGWISLQNFSPVS